MDVEEFWEPFKGQIKSEWIVFIKASISQKMTQKFEGFLPYVKTLRAEILQIFRVIFCKLMIS